MIVWLASYPRSGNTFFRVILNSIFDIKTYSIYDDKGDIGADEKTSETVGHEFLPKDFNIEEARREKNIYYIKTHELLDNRVEPDDNVIYLIRDGRESTLSFTKHQNTFSHQNKKIIDTIYGNIFIGSWGEHVQSWDPKNRKNTLLIKFEELIKDPSQYIGLLSEFLEITPVGDKIPTFEELKEINPIFFRSGKTNSWENIYSEEEHISFWLKNYKVMDEYGYDYKRPALLDDIENNRFILESINQNHYIMHLMIDQLEHKQSIINKKNYELAQKQNIINEKNKLIDDIYASKTYKVLKILTLPFQVLKRFFN